MLKSFLNSYFGIVVNQQIIPKLWHCSPTSYLCTSQLFYGLFRENIKMLDILFLVNVQQTTYLPRKRFLKKSRPKRRRHVHQPLWQLDQSEDKQIQTTNFLLLKVKRVHWMDIPILSKITWTLRINLFFFEYCIFSHPEKTSSRVNQLCFRPGYTSNHSSSTPSVIPDLFTLSCC